MASDLLTTAWLTSHKFCWFSLAVGQLATTCASLASKPSCSTTTTTTTSTTRTMTTSRDLVFLQGARSPLSTWSCCSVGALCTIYSSPSLVLDWLKWAWRWWQLYILLEWGWWSWFWRCGRWIMTCHAEPTLVVLAWCDDWHIMVLINDDESLMIGTYSKISKDVQWTVVFLFNCLHSVFLKSTIKQWEY